MAKQTYFKHVYNVSKVFKEVRHYLSEKPIIEHDFLTETINISKDRKFNNSQNVSYWLRIREQKKWSKVITGLKTTNIPLLYYGDIATSTNGRKLPRHLLIFHFNSGGSKVTVYLFKDYYPSNNEELIRTISTLKNKRGL